MLKDLALPGADVPVIDESRLMAEFGGDLEILAELRDLFLTHVPPLYEDIEKAMDAGDAAEMTRHAHTLKGACATYGAPRLGSVCLEMELLAKQGDMEGVNAYREHLAREYEAVCQAIANVGGG